jgi:23S rRNA pseudouridine1911/1915/1917 synthase
METFVVQPWQQNRRLDQLLHEAYSTSSRTYFQKLIEEELVSVNGKPVKKSYKPQIDDEIEVQFQLTEEFRVCPENIDLDILFEDDYLLVANKPAHMVVHPAHGNWTGTFVNALLYHCKNIEQHDPIRPGIVHRLDKETSGVLIAAKKQEALSKLSKAFAAREVKKRYLAIAVGKPKAMRIDAPIGRHPIFRKQMAVLKEGGKQAITHIEPLSDSHPKLTLLGITLETGRTHQIRVHLKQIGTPILGDDLYGFESSNKLFRCRRHMLHAESIAFRHPITNEPLCITAPLPADMLEIIEKF